MKKQKAPTVGAFLRLMPISHILNVSRCKYKRHYFVEVLDELDVRYFVSDADTRRQRIFFLCRLFSRWLLCRYLAASTSRMQLRAFSVRG